ncbi:MAG: oxygen-independent coproporphyrinogen III oxidase-like protein [Gammaproteobacteria bacterium]|nr:oxygen-independent coproporphyrinogen III oxidase-like protein [Gammaproteobacteria bacterium]MCP5138048.1 oxygen-independent coproporphyrinogen III oxidase-like protein [Gammaproteobacteria bacterium]
MQLPPLALYVHIPWCVRKCPYCDFNSHALREAEPPEHDYVTALLADLERQLPHVWGRTVHSVFIGGGTPSLFSATAIDALLSGIRARLTLHPDAEITLEANPGSVEIDRFRDFRTAGINRLSIGVQSFSDRQLTALGRIHDRREAIAAAETAHAVGFENLNIDLMHGLPGQNIGDACGDLRQAIALSPSHLSWYQLTLEPNTLFHARPPDLPDDDIVAGIEDAGFVLLAEAGYARYEISAFARNGQRSRHNLNYWSFGDYLGIGAGAHGKLTDGATSTVRRYQKPRHPNDYLRTPGAELEVRTLDRDDLVFEFMLNALRLVDGVPAHWFPARTGLPPNALEPAYGQAVAEGLLDVDRTRIRPTAHGLRFLNDLQARFLDTASCSTN